MKFRPINTSALIRYFNAVIHDTILFLNIPFHFNAFEYSTGIAAGDYVAAKLVKRLYEGLCKCQKTFRSTLKTWKTWKSFWKIWKSLVWVVSSFHCLQQYCLFCQLFFYKHKSNFGTTLLSKTLLLHSKLQNWGDKLQPSFNISRSWSFITLVTNLRSMLIVLWKLLVHPGLPFCTP